MLHKSIFVFLLLACMCFSQSTWITSFSQSNPLTEVKFTNGRFVAVGASGTILTSTDGTTWITRKSGTTNLLYSETGVTISSGAQFVVVGTSGTILTSPDTCVTWTKQNSGTTQNLGSVTYGGNYLFVAVGASGTILTSFSFGKTWVTRKSGTTVNLVSVTYGIGKFVIVGENMTAGGSTTSSPPPMVPRGQ